MRLILFLFFLFPGLAYSQLSDDFSDGDFTSNPVWIGDTSEFGVTSANQLRLNAPALTEESHLALPLNLSTISEWEFYVNLGFNPSGSNLLDFHLMSDSANLESDHNGYFMRVGGTGDEVSLFRKTGAASTKIIDGIDDRVNLVPVSIWVKVLRFNNGDWKVYSKLENESAYTFEGEVNDLTFNTSDYSGLLCDYTSTRSTLFWFDDFGYNQPPKPTALAVVGAKTLSIEFDEALENTSATTITNYSVSGGIGAPGSANVTSTNPPSLELTFANAFTLANSYNLTINNLSDTLGNTMTSEVLPFEYLQFATPGFRDIVINEIMADPSPIVGLPEIEFIEIHNATDNYFDLSTMYFSDPSTIGSVAQQAVIAPLEYIILCDEDDTASFSAFGRVIGLSAFPGLNNDGDVLSIYVDSVVIDKISYSSTWYNDVDKDNGGYTLEQINPENPCNGITNWSASQSSTGGTPGQQNSVYDTTPDTDSPELLSYQLASTTSIEIVFSKKMDSTSLATASYTIDNGLTVSSVSIAPETFDVITLTLSAPVDPSIIYTLTIANGITDCIGNALDAQSLQLGIGSLPQPFEVVITELYPDPDVLSAIPDIEFIEVYNRSEKLIRLEGLNISDASSSSDINSITLLPNQYAIVCDDGEFGSFQALGKVATVSTLPSLNNSGDSIRLTLGETVIDAVFYTDDWYRDEEKSNGGYTLERINVNDLCGLSGNWVASSDSTGGTPGRENSQADFTDPGKPELVSGSFESRSSVRLSFDRSMDLTSLNNAVIKSNGQSITNESSTPASILATTDTFLRGDVYILEIDSVYDCVGDTLTNASISLYLPAINDVVINEVLFNPRGSGTDFVELFNQSEYDINLENWSLAYLDSKDSLRFNKVSENSTLILEEGYIALNEDSVDLIQNYPQAAPENFITMNLPSYANDNGSVILYDQLGELVDQFNYNEEMHFALIDVTDGVSLERLDANRESTDKGNWHSASSSDNYATPGYVNSQDYPSSGGSATFSLSAEYVSPDNDGYQDIVNVVYTLGEPGHVAAVNVFNDKGVLVRALASNQVLGNSGAITWDGTNDLGEKARTGIHVILVETFDLEGNRSRYRLPVVVASRL